MDTDKILAGINDSLSGFIGALVKDHVILEMSEIILKKIKPDLCPKDLISYHEAVKVIEEIRPIKMGGKAIHEDKIINRIRDALRKLKKS